MDVAMQPVLCFEVLLATVLLWVAIFGLFDLLVEWIDNKGRRGALYLLLGLGVLGFLATHKSVSVCALM